MRFVLPYGNYRNHSVLSFVIFYALYFFSVKKAEIRVRGVWDFRSTKFRKS